MNWLNEIGKQVRELFASMTPASRIMAGLMLAVVVVSLGWIASGGSSARNYEYLFGGRDYSDAELTAWEAAFGEAKLREYERVGQRIRVPSKQKDVYLKALNDSNTLPKEFDSYMTDALTKGSPFDPNSLVDKRTLFAKEQRLTHMIQGLSGIERAFVNYDEKRTGFGRASDRVCGIAVKGIGGNPVPPAQLRNIAKMAIASFAGLAEENVTVSDLGNPTSFYRGSADPNASEENPYFVAQTQWEQRYESKIAALLSEFNAKVAVNVTLDPTLNSQSEQLQYQQQPVAVHTSSVSRNSENSRAAPGGQPGAAPNGISNQAQTLSASAVGQSSKDKEVEESERRLAGHEATVIRKAGLVPKTISVSIGIPESHYRKIALHRFLRDNPEKTAQNAPTPTAADLDAIRAEEEKAVRAAVATIPVGVKEGDDRSAYVEVYSFTDLPLPETPEVTMAQTAFAWFIESWSTLALIGLVGFSLLLMMSWVKNPPNGETAKDKMFAEGFGLPVPSPPIDVADLGADGIATEGLRRKHPAAEPVVDDLKGDLSSILRDNPDAAVNLIKTWIGEAA